MTQTLGEPILQLKAKGKLVDVNGAPFFDVAEVVANFPDSGPLVTLLVVVADGQPGVTVFEVANRPAVSVTLLRRLDPGRLFEKVFLFVGEQALTETRMWQAREQRAFGGVPGRIVALPQASDWVGLDDDDAAGRLTSRRRKVTNALLRPGGRRLPGSEG